MADVTITGLTTTLTAPISGAASILVGVDDNNGTPASKKIALSTVLSGTVHVIDPTGLTHVTTANTQAAIEELDAAIVSITYTHPNHTGDVTSVGDGATTIAANAVTTVKILNSNVTNAKLADAAAYTIKGRNAGTTGAVSDFTVSGLTEKASPTTGDWILINDGAASNAFKRIDVGNMPFNNYVHPNHSGDVTSVADGATTIGANKVLNSMLKTEAAYTILGRNAGTTGDVAAFTIGGLTEKATPVAGDWVVIDDSAASNAFKKVSVANLSSLVNTKPQIVHLPASAELPTSAAAAKSTHATTAYGRPVLLYDASTDEAAAWTGVLPATYAGGGLTVDLVWGSATGATTGNCIWLVAIESTTPDADSMNTDNFGADNTVTDAAPTSANTSVTAQVTFTDGADMGSLAAGEMYRIRVTRDADNVSDTLAGDAELYAVYVRET